MTVRIKVERDCYVYLLYYSTADKVGCLFPNEYQKDNFVRADQVVTIPAEGDSFRFRCSPPCGKEVLQVIGTLTPVDVLNDQNLTQARVTPLQTSDLKDMVVELKDKKKPKDWAEARIEITTVENQTDVSQKAGKRLGVCVGISQYKSDRIPQLQVSHQDAEKMADALKRSCQVSDVTVLTNEKATRSAIEQAIFQDLKQKSKPGDTLFVFFSCHGGRTADTNGDEQDGFDEYLVPYDGTLGQPDTMILDDTFARWIQELDGRKIAVILDNCYSGGASKGSMSKGIGASPSGTSGQVDFFDGELRRAKDLGQVGTMVLAACQANQLAWEMPAAGQGSVLTYNIIQSLDNPAADGNGDRKLSIGEVYRFIRTPVEEYVRKTFSADQSPLLLDNASDGVLLKP